MKIIKALSTAIGIFGFAFLLCGLVHYGGDTGAFKTIILLFCATFLALLG